MNKSCSDFAYEKLFGYKTKQLKIGEKIGLNQRIFKVDKKKDIR